MNRGAPGDEAIVTSAGRVWTHAALAEEVGQRAAALSSAGARPGRVVAVALKEPAAMLIASLAVWETGATLAPLDTRASTEKSLARARPAVIVDGESARAAADFRAVPDEAGLLLFTSGSSGEPKGVLLARGGIVANIDAILDYLPVVRFPRTAIVLPLVYSYALVGQAFTTLRAGGTVLLVNDMPYPAKQLELMVRFGASGFSSVATSLRLVSRAAAAGAARPALGYVASAGGPLDGATRDLVREVFPAARLFNQYGLTEASPRVTALSDEEPPFWQGSVGRAIRGVEVEIVGGELVVRGPSTMLGYLDQPEETARVLGPGGLRTGDVGRMDADGYVWVEGRHDGVVKVGGERVGVEEVAAVLRAAPGVVDACVVAVPDELYGMRLVAFVEGDAAAEQAARLAARDGLPPAKRPARVIVLATLPRLPSGKPALAELKRMALEG
jgi:long-chain acyl-CoA synthetase